MTWFTGKRHAMVASHLGNSEGRESLSSAASLLSLLGERELQLGSHDKPMSSDSGEVESKRKRDTKG